MQKVETLESEVRSYCRAFPAVFSRAQGALLFDEDGRRFIDFLSGAGSLNYGHNHPRLTRAVVEYIERGGIIHSLDLATTAKRRFIERFHDVILEPRGLSYKLQFTGPTGANGVEAALKLARKATRRGNVIAFSGGYHGLSAGALAVTANTFYRDEAFVNRTNVSFLPYDGYPDVDTLAYLQRVLGDPGSGVDRPAAVIVECIQGEGGVNVASDRWLRGLEAACRQHGVLLIADEIQAGNGRTGPFFSFERAGIVPDLVVLSKSLSGIGLPMTVLLIKPELDVWAPGEHSGTFRGNNLAFVAGAEALAYWEDGALADEVRRKGDRVAAALARIAAAHPGTSHRGLGLFRGLEVGDAALADAIGAEAFARGLIVEICGARGTTLKLLPPLVIDDGVLDEGLGILEQAVAAAVRRQTAAPGAATVGV